MPRLDLPEESQRDGMVFGTNRSRLALAMQAASIPEERYTFAESTQTYARYRDGGGGVDNPYGRGIAAYEPNTVIFEDYRQAYGRAQAEKREREYQEALTRANTATYNFGPIGDPTGGGGGGRIPNLPDATGKIGVAINAALELATRRVPYVWGGTTRNGVDCSGLIYYAFQAAGIDMPRYRAVDYGRMGTAVSLQDARPGDIVYWDNPGTDTDHVGIYLGNGKVVQAPTTGDVVKVTDVGRHTSIRRIFNDDSVARVATPSGQSAWATVAATWSPAAQKAAVSATNVISRLTGGRLNF